MARRPSRSSKKLHQPKITLKNVSAFLLHSKMSRDTNQRDECYSLLRQPNTVTYLSLKEYRNIADQFHIKFMKERCSTELTIGKIINMNNDGSFTRFFSLPGLHFVEYLDLCPPVSPMNKNVPISFETFFSVLRWAYNEDSLHSLYAIEMFLLSHHGWEMFNPYQMLHISQRFNLPALRMRCLSSLRTEEDLEIFKSESDYLCQLSEIDRELIDIRLDHFIQSKRSGTDIDYTWDVHSNCTFIQSMESRYEYVDDKDADESFYPSGFDGKIDGIMFSY